MDTICETFVKPTLRNALTRRVRGDAQVWAMWRNGNGMLHPTKAATRILCWTYVVGLIRERRRYVETYSPGQRLPTNG
jgi:hypothetical protein